MTDDEIMAQKRRAVVNRAMAILQEHFESAVVLVSCHLPGDCTRMVFRNSGNFFAQIGMAELFLSMKKKEVSNVQPGE